MGLKQLVDEILETCGLRFDAEAERCLALPPIWCFQDAQEGSKKKSGRLSFKSGRILLISLLKSNFKFRFQRNLSANVASKCMASKCIFTLFNISFDEILYKGLEIDESIGFICFENVDMQDLKIFASQFNNSKKELSRLTNIAELQNGQNDLEFMESQTTTFSKAIHGPTSPSVDLRIQQLSPMFSKLRVGAADPLSPSPERINSRNVKDSVPQDQEQKLVQTPTSLMFAVLGWSGDSPTVSIEAYDPMAQKWFYISQKGFIKRAYHGVVIMGILIYVIGGFDGRMCYNTVFCFNVETRQWYRRASMKVPRCYVTALGYRGMVYALGGFNGDERFKSCERFNPRTRRWYYVASMNDRRSDASAAVYKGKIFVCGGFNGVEVLMSAETYDPDQNQWTLISNMLSPRSGHALASFKGILVALGGYDGEARLRTVERFDDVENKWIQLDPMHSTRSNFGAAVLEDQLHVIGGYNGESTFAEVERFDDINKEWQRVQSLNKHRSALGACVFSDSMIVSMCTVPGHITVRAVNVEQPSP